MMLFKKLTARSSLLVVMMFGLFTVMATGIASAQDAASIPTDPAVVGAGKTLFDDNCAVCHKVHGQLLGPALKDLSKRRDVAWSKAFILNSQKVIQSGDADAVALYEEYGKLEMPAHDFSDDELNAILAYIKDESAKAPEVAQAEEAPAAEEAVQELAGIFDNKYMSIILAVNLLILVLILIVLGLTINVLTKYLNEKAELAEEDRELASQRFDFRAMLASKPVVFFVTLLFVTLVTKTVLDGLFSIGVQQGYAPTQPIAFSHEVHAGQYEIDCNYCHTGVTKSKNANIPSANICMNCHSTIKTDSEEVQKIFAAVENNQPIEWVRVHNLPDLAYFNHAQHVKVGGVECQTCHGEIQEMAVVKQHADLTMGWCVSCHRETKVNAEGNPYYDKLVEAHNKRSKEPLTVEDIGGLECSKCHY
ncbi:MAG: c-type cytochrome [Cytophagales bacterium]|nr:c-type cytochrome [Cytophagales bacterium]